MEFVTIECSCGVRLARLQMQMTPASLVARTAAMLEGSDLPEPVYEVQEIGTRQARDRYNRTMDGDAVTRSRHLGWHRGPERDGGPIRRHCRKCGRRWEFERARLRERVRSAAEAGVRRLTAGVDL